MDKNLKKLYKPVEKELKEVNKVVQSIINAQKPVIKNKLKSFLKSKGKLIRPFFALNLTFAMAKSSIQKEKLDKIIKFSAIVEILHTASLIHDDVIDNDEFRREKYSLNHTYGNKNAVLLGDIVYLSALDILNTNFDKNIMRRVIKVIQLMCIGQMNEPTNLKSGKKNYIMIIKNKTASLIQLACLAPVLVDKRYLNDLKNIMDYGLNLGMLYQIMDDIDDKDSSVPLNKNEIQLIYKKVKSSISFLKTSVYKDNLLGFADLLYGEQK